jgi:D-alanyl-D-alanine carboxypeptidase
MPALFLQFQAVAQSLLRVTRLAMSCSITDASGLAVGNRVTLEHTCFSFSGCS